MNCPFCDAVVSSRRSGKCGVCGKDLPEDCLFTPEQKAGIEEQMKLLAQRHRAAQDHMDRTTEHAHGGPFRPPRFYP